MPSQVFAIQAEEDTGDCQLRYFTCFNTALHLFNYLAFERGGGNNSLPKTSITFYSTAVLSRLSQWVSI